MGVSPSSHLKTLHLWPVAMAAVLLIGVPEQTLGADFSAGWLGGSGNWTTGSLWTTAPVYPNNGAVGTYDASIASGFPTLDTNIAIQRLTLTGGEITGSFDLTLNNGLTWSGGHLYTTGTINLATGSSSTISGSQVFFKPNINNSGTVTQTADVQIGSGSSHPVINNRSAGTWNIQQHYLSGAANPNSITLNNSGNFNALDAAFVGAFSNSGNVSVQSNIGNQFSPGGEPEGTWTFHGLGLSGGGTLSGNFNVTGQAALILGPSNNAALGNHYQFTTGMLVNGSGIVAVYDNVDVLGDATINSILQVHSGSFSAKSGGLLTLNGTSHFYQGCVLDMAGGGVRNTAAPIIIGPSAQLFGYGTIDGDLTAVGADLDPDFKQTLRINGDLRLQYFVSSPPYTFQEPANLFMRLFGPAFGNSFLSVGGSIFIDRAIILASSTPDFDSQIHSTDTFTLVQTGGGIQGTFFNSINGQLYPVGPKSWFRINYGPDSEYDPKNVVLSDGFVSPLTNGTFEAPANGRNVVGDLPGWTVVGNVAQVDDEGYAGYLRCASFSRAANSENDQIYQSFSTTVGQTYSLDFDSGVFGIPDGGAVLQIRVQVFGNGTLLDDTQVPPVANSFDPTAAVFNHYHYRFTANSTTTTLQCSDIGLGNEGADVLLDNVAVGPAMPAPTPTRLPLKNGNFEMPQTDSLGAVPGWTVSGNGKLKATVQGSTSGAYSAAFDATGESQGNVLAQRFVSVPGGVYSLDFDAGIFGKPTGAPLQLRAQVIGSAPLVDQTLTPANANSWDANQIIFNHYHFDFTADSTVTTLQFSDIGTGNAAADVELDTVAVAPHLTTSIGYVSGPSPDGTSVEISGFYLPNLAVRVFQTFDFVTYTDIVFINCDEAGFYSSTVRVPADRPAAFFKVQGL